MLAETDLALAVGGVLHDRPSAVAADGHHPGRAVVEIARQHDADHPSLVGRGGAAEERVDGRPVAMFPRAADHAHGVVALDEQMAIGRGSVDETPLQPPPILGLDHQEAAHPAEDLGEQARRAGRDVQHDTDGGAEVAGELAGDVRQRIDSASRGADDDDSVISLVHNQTPA